MVRREFGQAEGMRLQADYFRKAREIYKQITANKDDSQGKVLVLNTLP